MCIHNNINMELSWFITPPSSPSIFAYTLFISCAAFSFSWFCDEFKSFIQYAYNSDSINEEGCAFKSIIIFSVLPIELFIKGVWFVEIKRCVLRMVFIFKEKEMDNYINDYGGRFAQFDPDLFLSKRLDKMRVNELCASKGSGIASKLKDHSLKWHMRYFLIFFDNFCIFCCINFVFFFMLCVF